MDDLHRRLRVLDEVEAPDLWGSASERDPQMPPSAPSTFRRGMTIVLALALFAGAAAFGWTALRAGTGRSNGPARPSPVPAGDTAVVAEVVCGTDGVRLLTPVVALQADGFHLHVRNDAGGSIAIARGLEGAVDLLEAAGASQDLVIRQRPGPYRIGCVSSDHVVTKDLPIEDWPQLEVIDPNGYWPAMVEEDTCGEDLPPVTETAGRSATLAGPLTGRLLLDAWSDPGRGDILSSDADGTDIEQIQVGEDEYWDAAWSPDRSEIAYVSHQGLNDSEIFLMEDYGRHVR